MNNRTEKILMKVTWVILVLIIIGLVVNLVTGTLTFIENYNK